MTELRMSIDERSAVISDDGLYRYRLDRRWHTGGPLIAWAMLNPSIADEQRDDRTMRRVIGFSKAWGYSGCIVVNQYALRTPYPKEMAGLTSGEARGPENAEYVEEAIGQVDEIVAAWGDWSARHPKIAPIDIAFRARSRGRRVVCLGTTKDGHPLQPLARGKSYVRDDVERQPWEVR